MNPVLVLGRRESVEDLLSMSKFDQNPIIVAKLTAYRSRKSKKRLCCSSTSATAVNELHLATGEGVFGLLGTNGAGKSTTMRILAGKTLPSSGSAYIAGQNIVTQWSLARKHIGYCPQIDPIHDHLNAFEHLHMYGRLKGVPEFALKKMAKDLIMRTGLLPFAKKPSYTYSGGTKRKLSLAIALVGYPDVLLLDEPSSGMDPQSRREMWSIIEEAAAISSVILTSHSMEECEALCSRIGILRRASFSALRKKTADRAICDGCAICPSKMIAL